MPQISVRDSTGSTYEGLKALKNSRKEGNPFKDRALSYIALELINSSLSLEHCLTEYVQKNDKPANSKTI